MKSNGDQLSHRVDGGDVESDHGVHESESGVRQLLCGADGAAAKRGRDEEVSQWV